MLINQVLGPLWLHPRSFMIGLGHTFIQHVEDSSFPSDHLTLIWAVGFSFLMHRSTGLTGFTLALGGLPVAWARIYVGVHFLLDMVGAALVSVLSAWLVLREEPRLIVPLYRLAIRVHLCLFAPLIRHGWARK